MFGCGAVAQLILSGGSHGMFLTVNFAFGFAATLGILVCGQVSGNADHKLLKTVFFIFLGEHRKFKISDVAFHFSESHTDQNQILKRLPKHSPDGFRLVNYTTFFPTFRTFYFQILLAGIKGCLMVKVHSIDVLYLEAFDEKPYQTISNGSFDFNI